MIAHSNGKFPVFNGNNNQKVVNYQNYTKVSQEEMKICCGLGSGTEPRQLHCDSFEWFTIENGHVVGAPVFKLKSEHNKQTKGKGFYFEESYQERSFVTRQPFAYPQDQCSLLSIHDDKTSY